MDGQGATIEHMRIDHGGLDVLVAEQFLDCADVVAIFQQVGGEGMTEGVRGDAFLDPRFAGGLPDCLLQTAGAHVVAAGDSCARVP